MSTDSIRLFAAIPPDESTRQRLEQTAGALKQACHFQKWAHPADYHITLKFLGDTSLSRTEEVRNALAAVASRHSAFTLRPNRIGAFGAPAAPSILWVGITGEMDELLALQQDTEQELEQLGFPAEDRAYRPHITLARKYNGPGPFRIDRISQPEFDEEWTADRIVLYRSHLGRTPMYEAVAEYLLSGR